MDTKGVPLPVCMDTKGVPLPGCMDTKGVPLPGCMDTKGVPLPEPFVCDYLSRCNHNQLYALDWCHIQLVKLHFTVTSQMFHHIVTYFVTI